eukprot:TRINITY_DN30769_c0_g1_i1.p1 TRINITY_DN30769_c0_g1~~TRINITY_DN30769_c0_g1_i1.p1  ORF type:complete len:886 (-),score=244.33 TRINITY_DN30769_c0_g1_i1:306-2963(-)
MSPKSGAGGSPALAPLKTSKSEPSLKQRQSPFYFEDPSKNWRKGPRISIVDPQILPIGVCESMASRMRLDMEGNPQMLRLRLNNQNLIKELDVHQGYIVSNQFALMRPRPRRTKVQAQPLPLTDAYNPGFSKDYEKRLEDKLEEKRQTAIVMEKAAKEGNGKKKKKKKRWEDTISGGESPSGAAMDYGYGGSPTMGDNAERLMRLADSFDVERLVREGRADRVYKAMEIAEGGLPRGRVARAMASLGFHDITSAAIRKAIDECHPGHSSQIVTLEEFETLVVFFEQNRNEDLKVLFLELDADKSGAIDESELRALVWELGFTVDDSAVREYVKECDNSQAGAINFPDFHKLVTIINERYGFTQQECQDLEKLFDRFHQQNRMTAKYLNAAFIYFGIPTSLSQAQTIIMSFNADGSLCMSKCEFLRVVRMRLEQQVAEVRNLFAVYDKDLLGKITPEAVVQIAYKLGYTMRAEAMEEMCQDLFLLSVDEGLLFEEVLLLLRQIPKQEGFCKSEMTELRTVYKQHHPSEKEEMTLLELQRALTWLGYPVSTQTRDRLWVESLDLRLSDTINLEDFIKYVRIVREEEARVMKEFLHKALTGKTSREAVQHMRDAGGIETMLCTLDYPVSDSTLQYVKTMPLDYVGDSMPDVISMLDVVHDVRDAHVARLRKCAGLSASTEEKARLRFEKPLAKRGKVDPDDVVEFICDLFRIQKKHTEEYERVRKVVTANQKQAGGSLELMDTYWCVRHYSDARMDLQWRREQQAAKEENLGHLLDVLRVAFGKSDHRKIGEIVADDIFNVLDRVITVSDEQLDTIEDRLNLLFDGPKDSVDFASFLHLFGHLLRANPKLRRDLERVQGRRLSCFGRQSSTGGASSSSAISGGQVGRW